jgi:hypothetical protein
MVETVSGGYWEVDDMVCGVCEGECSGRREDGMAACSSGGAGEVQWIVE